MAKADEALEYALAAHQIAMQALVSVQAQGCIFAALQSALRDNNVLSHEAMSRVFLGAAAMIDSMEPADDAQQESVRAMRKIVEQIASGYGVKLPPSGQTGIPRTQ